MKILNGSRTEYPGKILRGSYLFQRLCKVLKIKVSGRAWCGAPPGPTLLLAGVVISLFMAAPVFYVLWRALLAGGDRWLRLIEGRLPVLLGNTLALAASVTLAGIVIGVSLSLLVQRYDLPGKNAWRWLLALPLVIPPYVGAMAYIIMFGPRGWLAAAWEGFPFNIYSFAGVWFVLTMFTYPYVFLICCSALKKMNRNFEEAGRSHGLSTVEIFRKITLPLLKPAIGSGAVLVLLYVLSDFGAVAMLRYSTFTAAIYYQMESYDNVSAAVLSFFLVSLTLIVFRLESAARGSRKYYQLSGSYRETETLKLGRGKAPAFIFVSSVFLFSVLIPVIVLLYWSLMGIAGGALDSRFWIFALNSIKTAGIASFTCMLFALPLIYLKSRHPSAFSNLVSRIASSGYALPGVIIAMGIIFFFNRFFPGLYGTFLLLPAAYIIRFLPQTIQSGDSSLGLISPRVDEAARSLGYPYWKVIFRVLLPLVLPGLLTGGALVFVSSVKELPATLMLRPPGFDTLSVRIWIEAGEAVYHAAAPAALFLILLSLLPLKWMLVK